MTDGSTPRVHHLLICSVGGTPDPIVQSLLHWRPDAVRFVVSQQTRQTVDAVLRSYAEHTGQPLSPGCYDCLSVDNAQDFGRVVSSLRTLAAQVHDWNERDSDNRVIVDFTAGTKCMSAALALVARRWPCEFSYVGGDRRSKDGVGVVESGSERIVHSANPWDALGYQAVEDAVTVFNHGGYAAAAHLLDDAMKKADRPEVKRELATLKAVVDAYAAWDRFDHKEAKHCFASALRNRNDLSAIFADAQKLIPRIEQHMALVTQLATQTEPTATWVEDLFRNAERRAAEHRYDDAVARLYRAVEALAQVRLREHHGIPDTKAVPLEKIPDTLRSEWSARARNGTVMLGLREAYALLAALDDDLGQRFNGSDLGNDEKSPLAARNHSILAHGFQPVKENEYNGLHQCLCSLASLGTTGSDDWRLPVPR